MEIPQKIKLLPLTSVQHDIWFDQMLNPDEPVYHIGGYTQVDTVLDHLRFTAAVNKLVEQHDALRIQIHIAHGLTPLQYFAESLIVNIKLIDLSAHADISFELQKEFVEPFDLAANDFEKRPLFRFVLIKEAPEKFGFLAVYHHLIADGWSIGLLHKQLGVLYDALGRTESQHDVVGDEHFPSYSDFIADDAQYLSSNRYHKDQKYWSDKFIQPPEPIFIPRELSQQSNDRLISELKPSQKQTLKLPRDLYNRLESFAIDQKFSIFHLLLSAIYLYFTRTTSSQELVLGIPVLNRGNAAFKRTSGLFAGVNAVRFSFGRELSFVELLKEISSTLRQDYRHQRFPVSYLNRQLALQYPGFERLFDIGVSFEQSKHQTFGALPVKPNVLSHGCEQTPLMLYVREIDSDKAVDIDFVYNLNYFDAAQIDRIQTGYCGVLQQVLENPFQRISEFDLLDQSQIRQLAEWNETFLDFPKHATVAKLFEKQVAITPHNPAVLFVDEQQKQWSLTYAELNCRSNQLAHYLQTYGIKPDTLVGICLDRSVEQLVAVLAVLKAGGAYVPLDPQYPPARLEYIIQDAGIELLICKGPHVQINGRVLDLLENQDAIDQCLADNPAIASTADHLAYVIYTSGSTGKPKGVMINQFSVVNTIHAFNHIYKTTESDRVLQQASFSFDVSVGEIFPIICRGGTLVMTTKSVILDPDLYADFLSEHQITIFGGTPSVLSRLRLDEMPKLRLIFSGGEALALNNVAQLLARAQLVNGYGPTETTIGATAYRLGSDNNFPKGAVPIGKPVPNYQMYVVNDDMQLLPIGSPGELCIGGVGVARGYLNNPDLTAEKFVELVVNGQPQRVYKSGDKVRWLNDGNLEYLGRIDNQVKLRGFRIELGEIEAVLCKHPLVETAAVVVVEENNDKRLAAYVTTKEGRQLTRLTLRGWLQDKIPDYMVPSAFVVMDALPLTPNGKLDRRALPAPEVTGSAGYEAPNTPDEALLCRLFGDLTGASHVSVADSFFVLGGHSLLAMQLVARVRAERGVELPLRSVFAHPTVRGLAREVAMAKAENLGPVVAGSGFEGDGKAVLSLGQERLWFLAQLEAEANSQYNMAMGLRLRGKLNVGALRRAFETLVERHAVLRTVIEAPEGMPQGRVLPPGSFGSVLEESDLRGFGPNAEAEAITRLAAFGQRPFDLERNLRLRALVIHIGTDEALLGLVADHSSFDGSSVPVFFDEISAVYSAIHSGAGMDPATVLAPLSWQFADWAAWQRGWLDAGGLEGALGYWERHLAGAPPVLTLPTDYERRTDRSRGARYHDVVVPAEVRSGLEALALRHGTTLYGVVLAGFGLVLSRLSNQDEVVIGSPSAGRVQVGSEALLGFFVNTLALRVAPGASEDLGSYLTAVGALVREGLENEAAPFERVVKRVGVERSLSHSPVFQVMFAWQSQEGGNLRLGELELESVELAGVDVPSGQAKFDLTLSLVPAVDGSLQGGLEYDGDLFAPATVARWIDVLCDVLGQFAATAKTEAPLALASLHFAPNDDRARRGLNGVMEFGDRVALNSPQVRANGNVNKGALPIRAWGEDDSALASNAKTETEQLLCQLWSNVLGRFVRDIRSDFFEVGGHSLLASQLAFRIRESFGIELRVATIFEYPVLQDLAKHLTQRQRIHPLAAIEAQPADMPKVLSFAQQRMWALLQISGDSSSYHIPAVLSLEGDLDIAALRQSLQWLVERHESLRMCFPTEGGEARLQVNPAYDPLTISTVTEKDPLIWVAEKIEQPFDLACGPLFRLNLLKIENGKFILVFNIHHIISDGGSIDVLLKDLAHFYSIAHNAGLNAKQIRPSLPIPLPETQYSDFAKWQRDWLQGDVLESQLGYWREQLKGIPALISLPTDHPRPAVMNYDGKFLQTRLDEALGKAVEQLASSHQSTLFMTLLAAFNVLLSRYSGQDDIVVGAPVANRVHHQCEEMVGLFVNTLVLRTSVDASQSFSQLLSEVRSTTLMAQRYQDMPFEMLVEKLNPSRDLSHSPLFQVMFGCRQETGQKNNFNLPGMGIRDISMEALGQESADKPIKTKFELTLSVVASDDEFLLNWEYSSELFNPETIARMHEHFEKLLGFIVANPDQPLANIDLLTAEERQKIIQYNQTGQPFPQQQTVAGLFEQQVRETPDDTAVYCGISQRYMSYDELNKAANRLAHALIVKGAGPESLVGICVHRSLDMVVAMLAVFKTGAGYLPLDPDYPQDRLAYMIQDSGIALLVTQSRLRDQFSCRDIDVVEIDNRSADLYDSANPARRNGPENLAYVIYTSGSTGKPKGVMIEQRSVVNMIVGFNRTYHVTAQDRVLQQASFCFDVSVGELLPIICCGGSLYLPARDVILDPDAFARFVAEHQISIFGATPTLLSRLKVEKLPHLRLIFSGGEALQLNNVEQLLEAALVVNGYGPTEATIGATAYRLNDTKRHRAGSVPIGLPVANYTTYILNPQRQHQPLGIPGELYIGGVGLARQYLNQPEMTADRFVEVDIFGTPQRLYKTGDLVRWGEQGIEFLGRIDRQIKLRGFRIELGEIEALLASHHHVKEAVVKLYDTQASQSLGAYVTVPDRSRISTEILHAYLATKLPGYMMPGVITILDTFPQTANGKIDRDALPDPEMSVSKGYAEPGTEVERTLVTIWQRVLKQQDIGIYDSFFERGGDSILLIQIVAAVRQAGLSMAPRDLYRYQNIAALALVLGSAKTPLAEQGLISGSVPLTPVQRAFFNYDSLAPWHFNQAVLLEVNGHLDIRAMKQAFASIIEHHDALRLSFNQINSQWQQQHLPLSTAIPWHEENLVDDEHQTLLARLDTWQQSLDLGQGPLLRMVLLHTPRQNLLFCCIHHLVVDGVSWRILLEDLQTAYYQVRNGQTITLPAKTTSFKHWAERVVQFDDGAADYWQKLNDFQPPRLRLDAPHADGRLEDVCHRAVVVDAKTTRQLLIGLPQVHGVAIVDALLCAVLMSLKKWCGQTSHFLDLESHGRAEISDDIDLSRSVGWFTSIYSILFSLADDGDLPQSLKSINKQRVAVPSEGVGYGIRRWIKDQNLPQGQILFNYLGQFDQNLEDGLFKLSDKPQGKAMSEIGPRDYLIEINGQIVQGQLTMTFSFSDKQFKTQTMTMLTDGFFQALHDIADECNGLVDVQTAIRLDNGSAKTVLPPLYLLPGSGSIVGYLRPLAAHIGHGRAVYGLTSPGMNTLDDIPQTIAALSDHHVKVIRQLQPEGPYALAGHSFGTAVAFEIAVKLEQQGQKIASLTMIDQPTRQYSKLGGKEIWDRREIDWLLDVAYLLQSLVTQQLPVSIQRLKDSGDLNYCFMTLMDWLRSSGADQVLFSGNDPLLQLKALVKTYRANGLAFYQYQPSQHQLKCAIKLICAKESLAMVSDEMPDHWGWAIYTRRGVNVTQIPGEHIGIFSEPGVQLLAEVLVTSTET
ncbi:non-ribosomal peptide synthetase [Thalassospira mesophila]|uniref:non-ribosomal peptide synthetase n=1 Tax=Thalassospira mesophila TaxID=1293891 RepID=UPI000A1E713D|nr:non-ribosomal peptide synthetase [Thalassospira mesophila]